MAQLEQDCKIEKAAFLNSLGFAVREKKLVKLNEKRFSLTSVLREYADSALELTADGAPLTVRDYRDRMGCGRNTAVDVLEYFDGIRFTRRTGDTRIIVNRALAMFMRCTEACQESL